VHSTTPVDELAAVALVVEGEPPPEVVAAAVAVAPPAELAVVDASPPAPEGETPASGSVQPWMRAIVAAATIAGITGEVRIDRA
jgi:hypothetical protein